MPNQYGGLNNSPDDPILMNLGSAGIGRWWNNLTGTSANNEFAAQEAEKARLFNSAEAQKNRDWETMMSNTAYQRAAADMKAAGINPASLGGNGAGSAASTPTGSAASGPAASATRSGSSIVGAVMDGIGMALKAKIARSTLSLDREGLDLKKFQAEADKSLKAAQRSETEITSALKKQDLEYKRSMREKGREETYWKDKDDWEDPFAGMSAEEKERMIAIANTPWLDS